MDLIVRVSDDSMTIDLRSIGFQADPSQDSDRDIAENIKLLRSIATDIESSYIMGMNNIHIRLRRSDTAKDGQQQA